MNNIDFKYDIAKDAENFMIVAKEKNQNLFSFFRGKEIFEI